MLTEKWRTEHGEVVEREQVEQDIAEVDQPRRAFAGAGGILTKDGITLVVGAVLELPDALSTGSGGSDSGGSSGLPTPPRLSSTPVCPV